MILGGISIRLLRRPQQGALPVNGDSNVDSDGVDMKCAGRLLARVTVGRASVRS